MKFLLAAIVLFVSIGYSVQQCDVASAPVVENAIPTTTSTDNNKRLSIKCKQDFIASPPGAPLNQPDKFKVRCIGLNTYEPSTTRCIYKYPASCADFFRREGDWNPRADGDCTDVTIAPLAENSTSPATVTCCKLSATELKTEMMPEAGTNYSAPGPLSCSGSTTPIMPETIFDTARSAVCGDEANVTYPLMEDDIKAMVTASSGECKQVVTIDCTTAAKGLSLALQTATAPSGFLYGSGQFDTRNIDIGLNHYTYANKHCDCASNGALVENTDDCEGGCMCTKDSPSLSSARTDTITKYLTASHVPFVTGYVLTQHGGVSTIGSTASFTVSVGGIECVEPFIP